MVTWIYLKRVASRDLITFTVVARTMIAMIRVGRALKSRVRFSTPSAIPIDVQCLRCETEDTGGSQDGNPEDHSRDINQNAEDAGCGIPVLCPSMKPLKTI